MNVPGFLHGHKLIEFVLNAEDKQFSMSRLGILIMVVMMVLLDIEALILIPLGRFPVSWFLPLAGMNSATVGSLAAAYYSSNLRGTVQNFMGQMPILSGPPKTKLAPPA